MTIFTGRIDLHALPMGIDNYLEDTLINWRDQKAISLTTSGSTGAPTLHALSDDLIHWNAHASKKAMRLSDNENVLVCLPTQKIGGLMLVLRSIIHKWRLTIFKPSANPLLQIPHNHEYSFASLVPYQLATILDHSESTKKLLRFSTILIGGAPLSQALEKKVAVFLNQGTTKVFHSYGMTETASHVALRNLRKEQPNTYELLPGVKASVNIEGCFVFEIPDLTFKVETNDLGTVDGQTIHFLSRAGDVVNSGGIKIHLHDVGLKIDNMFDDHQFDAKYFLWKIDDDKLGEKMVFVGLENAEQRQIEDLLHQQLPKYEVPKLMFWVKAFERKESGKIDRQKTVNNLIKVRR